MPVLLQICIVILTIGLLVCAFAVVRMIGRLFIKATADISQLTLSIRESIAQIEQVTQETRTVVAALHACVPPVRRAVDGLEAVGLRTAALTSTVLTELELPVYAATAIARGVGVGLQHLLGRVKNRFTRRYSQFNGGEPHE